MKRPQTGALAILAMVIFLVGCAAGKKGTEEEAAVVEGGTTVEPSTEGVESGTGFSGHPLDDPNSLLATKVVYFDYDRSDIRPEDQQVIEAHAAYIASSPTAVVSLEGHCDERGTREYNLALGERRSNAVRSLMTLMGASAQQLQTVSYGEERPVDPG